MVVFMVNFGWLPRWQERVLERFFAITAPPVPAEQKSTLAGRSGGCKRHAEHQNLVRQQQFFRSKSSSVHRSKTDASVTWWLLPAAKNTFFGTNFS